MTRIRTRLRSLLRSPGYTAAAILTLAVGIGAATAVFSVFNDVLLRPLPYPNADRLVQVNGTRDGDAISLNYLDLEDARSAVGSLEEAAGWARMNVTVTGDGPADQLRALAVESRLFPTLGVAPALGRPFRPEEDRPGASPVVLLSHGLWTERYGSDPGVVGRTVLLNDVAHEVVGVMPRGFAFPDGIVLAASSLWVPMGLYESIQEGRDGHPGIYAVGLLARGRSVDAARAELDAVAARLAARYPDTNEGEGFEVRPALEAVIGDVRGALWIVMSASLLILLLACSNVANLLLARATARHREMAVRNALGAGRARIVGLVLAESLALAAAGAAVGLAVGWMLVRSSAALLDGFPRAADISLDPRVAAFAVAMAAVAALAAGAAPALRAARVAAMAGLRSRDPGSSRVSPVLVVGQVALTLGLLVVAGLLGESLRNLRTTEGGITPDGVLTFRIGLPEASYDEDRAGQFYASLFERLEGIPGVRSAGAISTLPFSGAGAQSGMLRLDALDADPVRTDVAVVANDYFETLSVERVAGRTFGPGDAAAAVPPVVVDERFAARMWPGEDPLGKQVQGWGMEAAIVVGVVRHVKNYGVGAESREELYASHAARPWRNLHLVVRADGDPTALLPAVRQAVAELDSDVPVERPRAMTEVVDATSRTERLLAILSRAFATVALLLAALGLYGLLSYSVRRAAPEIGLRMALGATTRHVAGRVVGGALRLTAAGAAAGVLLGVAGARWLRGHLFGVSPLDPGALALAVGVMLGVAAVAAAVPALRAAGVEPMETLGDG
jgi:putative ABC transport system permease protein